MKIAYLAQHVDNVSGIGRVVRALSEQMKARGHEVHCVSQSCDDQSLHWHKVASLRLSNGVDKLLYRTREPYVSATLQCDIGHSMGVGKAADVVSAGSCHKAGIELARSGERSRLRSRNWGLFDRLSLEDERRLVLADSTRVIIAVSRLVRDQLLEHYPIAPDKIIVIPNGVDTSLYATDKGTAGSLDARAQMGIRPEEIVLLFVGNEFLRKGVPTLIESLPLLSGFPVVALIAGGDNPRPYMGLCDTFGVASRVRFLGTVRNVENLFGVADMFIFPTSYEPFGLVIIEAMAAGVPVITNRRAGAVEDMVDGRHGLYLEDCESPSELARSIRRLIEEPGLASQIAETSRRYVERFDWRIIAESFDNLYVRVAAERSPAGHG